MSEGSEDLRPFGAGDSFEELQALVHRAYAALAGRGLGTRLIRHVEARAAALGAKELALDTSEHATDLIAWYERLGYRLVDGADWRPDTNSLSVVMSKTLRHAAP